IPSNGAKSGGCAHRYREAVLVGHAGVDGDGEDRFNGPREQPRASRWNDGQRSVGQTARDGRVPFAARQRPLVGIHLLSTSKLWLSESAFGLERGGCACGSGGRPATRLKFGVAACSGWAGVEAV